ncbi:hypothetical protein MUK70_00280 [Dyadobacter chenwenxiniae]|uniref:Uncharacterized protein n=1 Tax=Dyadobacter chenwenxiniae TaxID=2906456 RepID=A0A9X1TG67_9BACT|nr:hypothetical protein [Dyadobacter chenwenxiniae]MCF0063762.1 hypothetical protein [Dyadobacter chenwenxiniae]UON83438.1 hypothetical protein MUK70_00280 [Dyadobacter chenwenxiniae]
MSKRFEKDAALNQPDRATMFDGGEHNYTDYPALNGSWHLKNSFRQQTKGAL